MNSAELEKLYRENEKRVDPHNISDMDVRSVFFYMFGYSKYNEDYQIGLQHILDVYQINPVKPEAKA